MGGKPVSVTSLSTLQSFSSHKSMDFPQHFKNNCKINKIKLTELANCDLQKSIFDYLNVLAGKIGTGPLRLL